jgi:hypothetical protein
MKTVNKISGDNLGGILKLWLVFYNNLASDSEDASTGIHTITFTDNDKIWLIECSDESLQFSEDENTNFGSPVYKTSLSAFIPNDTPVLKKQLDELTSRPWILILKNQEGYYKKVGSEDCPLRMVRNFDIPKQVSDRKGYTISFKGDTFFPSVFINNPF